VSPVDLHGTWNVHLSVSSRPLIATTDPGPAGPRRHPHLVRDAGPGGSREPSGGNFNRILSESHGGIDVHQLNATYYSTLDCDDDKYVVARAIQLFARGVPQIYYVGLLAGENDIGAVARTGDGRAINRHDYTMAEIGDALDQPVVARIVELIKLRYSHPAFDGTLCVERPHSRSLALRWTDGQTDLSLEVDFMAAAPRFWTGPRRGTSRPGCHDRLNFSAPGWPLPTGLAPLGSAVEPERHDASRGGARKAEHCAVFDRVRAAGAVPTLDPERGGVSSSSWAAGDA
jgi:hypothetical protein